MKTLIFNGSPRKNGDTVSLIRELTRNLPGEIKMVNAYFCDVKPCIDCRFCWEHEGCAIKDEMQSIYEDIQSADNIVLASPIHFTEMTGQLLSVLSRLQTYWSARYLRRTNPVAKYKRGAVILIGGSKLPMDKAEHTARFILREMNAETVSIVKSPNTNDAPSIENEDTLEGIRRMAKLLGEDE